MVSPICQALFEKCIIPAPDLTRLTREKALPADVNIRIWEETNRQKKKEE